MGIARETLLQFQLYRKSVLSFICHFFNGMHCINNSVEVITEPNLIIGRRISEIMDSRTINRLYTRLEISCKMLLLDFLICTIQVLLSLLSK